MFGIDPDTGVILIKIASVVAAGFCMGVGAIGPALGEGFVGGKAMESLARQPESEGTIIRSMLLADAVAESTGIYSLVIAIILLFANPFIG